MALLSHSHISVLPSTSVHTSVTLVSAADEEMKLVRGLSQPRRLALCCSHGSNATCSDSVALLPNVMLFLQTA